MQIEKRNLYLFFFLIATFILLHSYFFLSPTINIQNTSDNLIYISDKDSIIRYKYIGDYESLENLHKKLKGEPVYSLEVNGEKIMDVYSGREHQIPEVSKAFKARKNIPQKLEFTLVKNKEVDLELTRFDLKIIVEELRKGKWTPVHQAVFKERGEYWSLDKGPIEFIK